MSSSIRRQTICWGGTHDSGVELRLTPLPRRKNQFLLGLGAPAYRCLLVKIGKTIRSRDNTTSQKAMTMTAFLLLSYSRLLPAPALPPVHGIEADREIKLHDRLKLQDAGYAIICTIYQVRRKEKGKKFKSLSIIHYSSPRRPHPYQI